MRLSHYAALAACFAVSSPVALSAQTVTLAAEGTTRDTVAARAEAYRGQFTLIHVGSDSGRYDVACAGLGAVACVPLSPEPLRVAPGESVTVEVDYHATRAGQGLVVLRVRDVRTAARATAGRLITVLGS